MFYQRDGQPAGEHRAGGGQTAGEGQAELEGDEDLPQRDGDCGSQRCEGTEQPEVKMTKQMRAIEILKQTNHLSSNCSKMSSLLSNMNYTIKVL